MVLFDFQKIYITRVIYSSNPNFIPYNFPGFATLASHCQDLPALLSHSLPRWNMAARTTGIQLDGRVLSVSRAVHPHASCLEKGILFSLGPPRRKQGIFKCPHNHGTRWNKYCRHNVNQSSYHTPYMGLKKTHELLDEDYHVMTNIYIYIAIYDVFWGNHFNYIYYIYIYIYHLGFTYTWFTSYACDIIFV